jgi:hypothetical protein
LEDATAPPPLAPQNTAGTLETVGTAGTADSVETGRTAEMAGSTRTPVRLGVKIDRDRVRNRRRGKEACRDC